MTRANLKTLARAYEFAAKTNKISNALLELILNQACIDIVSKTLCLPTSEAFDTVADESDYDLSDVVTDYLTVDKAGLFYRSSSTANYVDVDPTTKKWLDNRRQTWRDLGSGTPNEYFIENGILTSSPAPSSAITDGFLLNYISKPVDMTSDDDYPFSGTTTELSHLSPLDDAILAYWEWKSAKIVNEGMQVISACEAEYKRVLLEKGTEVMRTLDISNTKKTKFQGRNFQC